RNATANITVNFTPLAEGMFSASLQIIDNVAGGKFARGNGAKSTHNIPLTGEGYDSAISTFPFAESFDGSSFPPTGWTNIKTAGTSAGLWERTLVGTYPDCMPHSGEGMAKYNCFSYQPNTEGILVTPPISFSDLNYEVSFWMYRDGGYPTNLDMVNVYGSVRADLSDVVYLGTIYRSLELEPFVDEAGWYQYSFPIPSLWMKEPGNIGYIIFEGSSGYGNNIFIDDVLIDVAPEEIVIDGDDQTPLPDGVTVVEGGTVPSDLLGEDSGLPAQIYTVTATGIWNVTVNRPTGWSTDWYCWIMVGNQLFDGPNPISGMWMRYTFEDVNFDAKGTATVVINDNQTLPVELSSFTATVSSELFVTLKWVSESETDHAGYNVYRAESNVLDSALRINTQIIDDGAANGTQMSYAYSDFEAYNNMQYYYWLESVSLGGISQFFGPLSVVIGNLAEEPEQPEIQLSTKLMSAFPNPFNPNTNLRYSLKEAGNVAIDVYNLKGQLIRSFKASHSSPGFYQVAWDGRDNNGQLVSSGIYMYRMSSGRYSATKKMILAK
ncbi:MAG: choice-of-anchor J domain-containing protein, partial [Candidatus Cloacimonetes bacterium]|nr:choice-of-anchor J domain-containing protein [Candidatus Cloacimonadota bacterium]